ncbi:MAG: tRNA (guanine37-N1)-methyltransferase [Candidatus Azotimanducaceae bacterium]|jgi:tRNA (guanine37-N1)-methyltransferase
MAGRLLMWIGVVTLFPEMFQAVSGSGISRRAVENGILELEFWNPRDYTTDKHRTVDDKPYGGGPGMLMKVEPLREAIEAAKAAVEQKDCKVIYLSPQGKKLDQKTLSELATEQALILVAGRYEGIDERLIDTIIDEELSIGDYVLSGGELPAMVLIDGLTRLQAGAVGDVESVINDSFVSGLLDYPQYTRPEAVSGESVPGVLLSGNHKEIERWRLQQSLGRTFDKRPDLLKDIKLSELEQDLLDTYLAERKIED